MQNGAREAKQRRGSAGGGAERVTCLMNEIRNFVALLSLHCAAAAHTHTRTHTKANGKLCAVAITEITFRVYLPLSFSLAVSPLLVYLFAL